MLKFLYIVIVSLCCFACQSNKADGHHPILTVSLDKANSNIEETFDKVRIIPLEDRDGLYLQSIDKIKLDNDTLYIFDAMQKSVSLFTLTGELINQIRRVGRSREEYIELSDFDINKFESTLLFLDSTGKINEYDKSGNFIQSIKLPRPPYNFKHLLLQDSTKMITWSSTDDKSNSLNFFDLKSRKVIKSTFSNSGVWSSFRCGSVFHQKNGDVFYHEALSGKVYNITSKKADVAYEWDFGIELIDDNILSTSIRNKDQHKSIIDDYRSGKIPFSYIRQLQSNEYYCTTIKTGKFEFATVLYNKQNEEYTIIKDSDDGVVKFAPEIITDKYILAIICSPDIDAFMEYAKGNKFEITSNRDANYVIAQLFFK